MLTKSMFTHSVLQDTKIQKKELGYFYGKYFINFFSLCALWHSSKIWQENKWSKYFGRKLTNFQTKLLKDEVTLSKIKPVIFSSEKFISILTLKLEHQRLVITVLMEMGIFQEIMQKQVEVTLNKSYKDRKNLLDFMKSEIFEELCISYFTRVGGAEQTKENANKLVSSRDKLEKTFSKEVTKPILEEGISFLHNCNLASFEKEEQKYRQVLLNLYPEITEKDEKFIASYKRDKLEQFLKIDFSKYEGDLAQLIDCVMDKMTQEEAIQFFLILEVKNVPLLISICKDILKLEVRANPVYENYEKFKALINICKSMIHTLINQKDKLVLGDLYFQSADFCGLKVAYKNINNQAEVSRVKNMIG